LSDVYSSFLHK